MQYWKVWRFDLIFQSPLALLQETQSYCTVKDFKIVSSVNNLFSKQNWATPAIVEYNDVIAQET